MEQFAIAQLSIVPVRSSASDREEIVTQLLFGELVEVLEVLPRRPWCRVRCSWDGYEGWCDPRQLLMLDSTNDAAIYAQNSAHVYDFVSHLTNSDHFLPITMGASLPQFDGFNINIGNQHYTFSGQALPIMQGDVSADFILKLARRYLYTPYLWGGRSPMGIDCSGFTQIVYKMAGIRLQRDASQQVHQGRTVYFIEHAQAGDLAFFENERGKIIHVGIVLNTEQIIHASARVRIDKIDHYGIYNEEEARYSHKLRIIKRFLPDLEKIEYTEEQVQYIESIEKNQISLF